MPELWYDIANRQLLEYIPEGVTMQHDVSTVRKSYTDMMGRVKAHYDRKFDRRWPSIVRNTRKLVGDLPKLQAMLDMFEPEYSLLREKEEELYQPMERNDGLMLCRQLYLRHDRIEYDMHGQLSQLPNIGGKQVALLFGSARKRTAKGQQLRREVRLIVDQGLFIVDDAERKAECGRWADVDMAATEGLRYLHTVLMPTPPIHN